MISFAESRRDLYGPGAAGFTLLEMLVVLVILGLLAALATEKIPTPRQADLDLEATQITKQLHALRSQAIRTGISRTFAILTEPTNGKVSIEITVRRTQALLIDEHPGTVRFFPDGTSTGGAIMLRQGLRHIQLFIRGLDGSVQTDRS